MFFYLFSKVLAKLFEVEYVFYQFLKKGPGPWLQPLRVFRHPGVLSSLGKYLAEITGFEPGFYL